MIRRNVDVLAVAILLGVLALCSKARSIAVIDLVGRPQVVLAHFDEGHVVNVSCPLPPSLVLR